MVVPLAATALGGARGFTCLTGVVRRQAPLGIPFPGQFLLRSGGQNIAALVDAGAGLGRFVGRNVTVCGFLGPAVEGLPVLRATTVLGAPGVPVTFPPFALQVRCFVVPTRFG